MAKKSKKGKAKSAKAAKVADVMHRWKAGDLHSGSKKGPIVRRQKQAIAIALSEASGKSGRKGKAKGKRRK